MKLKIPHFAAGTVVLLAGLLLAGCDRQSNDAKHIKVGVINGAEQDVAEVAKKVAKEKYGPTSSWWASAVHYYPTMPLIMANWMPTSSSIVRSLNRIIKRITISWWRWVIPLFSMAGYSKKIKTVAELKDGATIAIPNDPTNLGRALLLLQKKS